MAKQHLTTLFGFFIIVLLAGPLAVQAQGKPTLGKICEQLSAYDQAGANFIPGVDVNGNPVAPADLENNGVNTYDPIIIPITVDLSGHLSGLEGKPEVSYIEVYHDGRVLLNGEDIGDDIRATCPLGNPDILPEQDGQESADPLVSGENKPQTGTNGAQSHE